MTLCNNHINHAVLYQATYKSSVRNCTNITAHTKLNNFIQSGHTKLVSCSVGLGQTKLIKKCKFCVLKNTYIVNVNPDISYMDDNGQISILKALLPYGWPSQKTFISEYDCMSFCYN
jgi:hypothetical protein